MAARREFSGEHFDIKFYEKSFSIDGRIVFLEGDDWEDQLIDAVDRVTKRTAENSTSALQYKFRKLMGL